jgi:hypothetical protein
MDLMAMSRPDMHGGACSRMTARRCGPRIHLRKLAAWAGLILCSIALAQPAGSLVEAYRGVQTDDAQPIIPHSCDGSGLLYVGLNSRIPARPCTRPGHE